MNKGKLIVANWKMNFLYKNAFNFCKKILLKKKLIKNKFVICPPTTLILQLSSKFKGITFGAQDCHYEKLGAYTGDISALMLKDINCKHVIIGHSERRKYSFEDHIILKRKISISSFIETLIETAKITTMLFFLLFGAIVFSNFINLAGLPNDLVDFLSLFNFNLYTLLIGIFIIYLILGMILESLSMMMLTVPIFYPLVSEMGGNLIWFGILVVVAVEISLITPPVGLNVHILKTIVKNTVSLKTIFK
mgnify:CR=1 FL=1